jgi:thioredoxin-like negative regulator of GroEL
MKSAAVLMLATVLGLALLRMSGLTQRSAEEQPQTSPPSQVEPQTEKPRFTKDYEEAMREKDRKVILVFGADWCPACVVLKKHLEGMNLDGYLVCVLDVDESRDIKRKHGARMLPTSIIMEDGKEVSRHVGFDKQYYDAWVEENR